MRNPWTKKNPMMSIWLSAANSMANRARGHATAAARRESNRAAKSAVTEGMRLMTDFWTAALKPPAPRRSRKRR